MQSGEVRPRLAAGAVVLAHGAPRALGIRTPLVPGRRLLQTVLGVAERLTRARSAPGTGPVNTLARGGQRPRSACRPCCSAMAVALLLAFLVALRHPGDRPPRDRRSRWQRAGVDLGLASAAASYARSVRLRVGLVGAGPWADMFTPRCWPQAHAPLAGGLGPPADAGPSPRRRCNTHPSHPWTSCWRLRRRQFRRRSRPTWRRARPRPGSVCSRSRWPSPWMESRPHAMRRACGQPATGSQPRVGPSWRTPARVAPSVRSRGSTAAGAALPAARSRRRGAWSSARCSTSLHTATFLDAALGPVTGVSAAGGPAALAGLTLEHEGRVTGGAVDAGAASFRIEPAAAGRGDLRRREDDDDWTCRRRSPPPSRKRSTRVSRSDTAGVPPAPHLGGTGKAAPGSVTLSEPR